MKDWFYPENLRESEQKCRNSNDDNPHIGGDFGSYKSLLKTNDLENSMIKFHNDINPAQKLKLLKKITDKFLKNKKIHSILNVGCGTGFETKVLSEIYNCDITGVDASLDGIDYAKKYNSNSKTEYIFKTIDSNFLLNTKFDICYAIEFYPFTRTKDLEFQKNIISSIFNNLSNEGVLVMYQLETDKWHTIKNNIQELSVLLKKNVKTYSKFHYKIYKFIPNYFLSKLCCLFLEKILNRDIGRQLIIFY
tara:strand:- start:223 stop:969 length:747 start_codon:yes stop_codon:yes gene_type:complete